MLADSIPIYPLYALLFADTGLSGAQISTLFLVWSAVGIVAEAPTGALADRFSRRSALALSSVFQAAGYVLWIVAPGYASFAAGFALWGFGGALGSGAREALLYESLAAVGAERHYPRIYGRVNACQLISQLPAAGAATALFAAGGYELAGWVSVLCCLAASAAALRLDGGSGASSAGASYVATLRAGLAEVAGRQAVRAGVVAVALLGSLDGLEEYFTLLAAAWGVSTALVPLALLAVPLAGAAGAALGGRAAALSPRALGRLLAAAVAVFTAAGLLHRPVGIAGVAVAYGLYQAVLVVTDAHLQATIQGSARATVTSVASLGADVCGILLYAAWATGQLALLAVAAFALAAGLPALLGAYQSEGRSSALEPKK